MGANLRSPLLRVSIQMVCRLQLGLHSLIIYPGEKRDKLMSKRSHKRSCVGAEEPVTYCLQEAVGSGAAAGLKSFQLCFPALAGAHKALNISSFNTCL